MGRRTAEETEALRAKIVECAVIRFAESGRDATSMVEIARDVGISKQALMHHFRNREALDAAIAERFREHLDGLLPKLVAAFTADEAELDPVLTEILSAMDQDIHFTRFALRRILFAPAFEAPPAGRAIAQLMLDYLRRGQREGRFRPDFEPAPMLFNLGMLVLAGVAATPHRAPVDGARPMAEVRLMRSRELVRIVRHALLPDAVEARSPEGA